jgi:hypothetical protein
VGFPSPVLIGELRNQAMKAIGIVRELADLRKNDTELPVPLMFYY